MSEATCLWPTPGNFVDHAARFIDPALGFAMGFSEWFAWMTVAAGEGANVRIALSYWTESFPTAASMTIYLAIVFAIHALPNRWFAEFEFGTSVAKVIAMLIFLITTFAIMGGAGPTGSVTQALNYTELPAFPHGFKGVCMTFTLAAWATGGQEIMGITAGESRNPRWDMPRACRNLIVRIVVIFELSIVAITILVPYTDPRLLGAGNAAASPFVIAMVDAGIKGLPDVVNVIIILGLCAIGAESIYVSSRMMYSMAHLKMMPIFLGRVDKQGRPYTALLVTGLCSTICTYINCAGTGATVFTWFSSVSATTYFTVWMAMACTNVMMHRAIKLQDDPAWRLPHAFKLRAYPATAIYMGVVSFLLLLGTGYVALFPIGEGSHASAYGVFETMLGVPVFLAAWGGYKLYFRTSLVDPAKADLMTGRRPLSKDEVKMLDDYYAQPMWKRFLSYVRF
ncbi:hypothetical protein MBLNU459_g2176t2 [Dothideomycetes sp. NU459]